MVHIALWEALIRSSGIRPGSVGIGSAAASEIVREQEESQQSEKMHFPGPAPA